MPAARFGKRVRLLNAAQFDAVFKKGRRISAGMFVAMVANNELGFARVGFAFSKKHAPLSVQRNRIRRLLREHFRTEQQQLAAVDLVLMLRGKLPQPAQALTTATQDFWRELAKRCAAS